MIKTAARPVTSTVSWVERCDACYVASATVRARSIHSNKELFFCGHHAKQHRFELSKGGWLLEYNERYE